ncbi:hypothetical protein DENSPDRAFT_45646 [Dentipellis sp. KUC8613]|nr:hypothetical protein DENSPDRAFT_45646 [Dentipellis sp. KUC8613]
MGRDACSQNASCLSAFAGPPPRDAPRTMAKTATTRGDAAVQKLSFMGAQGNAILWPMGACARVPDATRTTGTNSLEVGLDLNWEVTPPLILWSKRLTGDTKGNRLWEMTVLRPNILRWSEHVQNREFREPRGIFVRREKPDISFWRWLAPPQDVESIMMDSGRVFVLIIPFWQWRIAGKARPLEGWKRTG